MTITRVSDTNVLLLVTLVLQKVIYGQFFVAIAKQKRLHIS